MNTTHVAPPSLRVAVIGGGPSAMFFVHALNQQRALFQQQEEESAGGTRQFIDLDVTCFEKADTPGGVWRDTTDSSSAIYDELWTNSPAHCIEFYDHTFTEHFGNESVPMYFPRRDMNEYLMQRVTKNAPNFFEDYFEFNSEVVSVVEEDLPVAKEQVKDGDVELNRKFLTTVRDTRTGELSVAAFDKVVWAAGINAKGYTPEMLKSLFATADITNKNNHDVQTEEKKETEGASSLDNDEGILVLHSTETDRIRSNVVGKRVLLVGGSYSAEDLALQCLKWSASHVDIISRSDDSVVSWTTRWPANKVSVHTEMAIQSVQSDRSIVLEKVIWKWPGQYVPISKVSSEQTNPWTKFWEISETTAVLRSIDVVVFCTGYQADLSMLDLSLKPFSERLPNFFMGTHSSMYLDKSDNSTFVWDEWTMNTNHRAHEYIGNVPAAQERMLLVNYNHPEMHRGILFKNPNIMFLTDAPAFLPLLHLDANAWLLCSYLTGFVSMPTVEELQEANRQQVLEEMHLPYLRNFFDEGYHRRLLSLIGIEDGKEKDRPSYFSDDPVNGCPSDEDEMDYVRHVFLGLAKMMHEGNYPGISFGTTSDSGRLILSDVGESAMKFMMESVNGRYQQSEYENGSVWRTFRDDPKGAELVYSMYTNTSARSLKTKWLDIVGRGRSIKDGGI